MYELVAEFGSVTWGNGSDIKQRRRRERGKKTIRPGAWRAKERREIEWLLARLNFACRPAPEPSLFE